MLHTAGFNIEAADIVLHRTDAPDIVLKWTPPGLSRYLELELMALSAVVLAFAMLMVTQVAVRILPVVG